MKRWTSAVLFAACAAGCAPSRPPAGLTESGLSEGRDIEPKRSVERVSASAREVGARAAIPVSWVLVEQTDGPGCFGLARPEELLCRADRRVIQARAAGDAKLVSCYRRRSSELRMAYRLAEASREHLRTGEGDELDRERLGAAEKALERGYASLERCAAPPGGDRDTLRVITPALPTVGSTDPPTLGG
jgi:hypothetical protein